MKKFKNIFILIVTFTISITTYAQLKVTTTGWVNIGNTNNPSTKFQVTGNSLFTSCTSGCTNSSAYIRGNNGYSSASTPDYSWWYSDQTGLFHPSSNVIGFSIGGAEIMRMDFNVNIGLTSGNGRLNVYGNNTPTAFTTAVNHTSDYQYASISYVNRQTSRSWVVSYNSSDKFIVTGSGDVFGHSFNLLSDSSLKENIKTISSAMDKVKQLRGVSFNFKKEVLNNPYDTLTVISTATPKTEIGFIAQEVESVVPEVVTTTTKGEKTVAYANLVALLVEAIKEQEKKITEIQADLESCCKLGSISNDKLINPSGNENISDLEQKSILYQNTPNPFSNETQIKYYVPTTIQSASLYIYNMEGTQLKKINITNKGNASISIQASELKAGMYMYSLICDGKEIETRKMILTD